MSRLCEAFKIPINVENKYFVTNPYIPFQTIPTSKSINPKFMTTARIIDIKYGTKNCLEP